MQIIKYMFPTKTLMQIYMNHLKNYILMNIILRRILKIKNEINRIIILLNVFLNILLLFIIINYLWSFNSLYISKDLLINITG